MDESIVVTIRGNDERAAEVAENITEAVAPGTKVEVHSGEDVVIHTVPESQRKWLVEYLRQEFA